MNKTDSSELSLINHLNDLKASSLLPVVLYISLLIVFGVTGNAMVCYFYIARTKLTTNSFFILCLAVFDLVSCCVLMPTEIWFDLYQFYKYSNRIACKVFVFGNYFTAISSVLALCAIAVDRYKHICRTSTENVQISVRKTMKIGTFICIVSVLLNWPAFLLYGTIPIDIPNSYGLNLTGSDCTAKKEKHLSPYITAFNMMHLSVFFVSSLTLVILYGVILRSIFKHKNILRSLEASSKDDTYTEVSSVSTQRPDGYNRKEECSVTSSSTIWPSSYTVNGNEAVPNNTDAFNISSGIAMLHNNTSVLSMINSTVLTTNANVKDDKQLANSRSNEENVSQMNPDMRRESKNKDNASRAKTRSIKDMVNDINTASVRITTMMIVVTVAYIISFLPSLSLIIWRTFTGSHVDALLTSSELVAYEIGLRSYFVNSCVNPWIYGVFNKKFRQFYCNLLFCRRT